eukprot:GCRY01001708.1.p1 GENE.GCRY01001708.1~~GCRY01001708.1.p1  ORF type:complete len:185 (-),score=11.02 GCRY01001708.1:113-667(-)
MFHLWKSFILVSTLLLFIPYSSSSLGFSALLPDTPLSLSITPNQEKIFAISELQPSSSYEIRVSYPANYPAQFLLQIVEEEAVAQRTLMNIEKIMFNTDPNGQIMGHGKTIYLKLQAFYQSPSVDVSNLEKNIPFNIVLETLYMGGIPIGAFEILVVLAVYFAIFLVVGPKLRRLTLPYPKRSD